VPKFGVAKSAEEARRIAQVPYLQPGMQRRLAAWLRYLTTRDAAETRRIAKVPTTRDAKETHRIAQVPYNQGCRGGLPHSPGTLQAGMQRRLAA
jgi:hypothetical protein